jgi:hypothetical protein
VSGCFYLFYGLGVQLLEEVWLLDKNNLANVLNDPVAAAARGIGSGSSEGF